MPISYDDPSGLFESGGNDEEKREIERDGNGKPTAVRLGERSVNTSSYTSILGHEGTGSHNGGGRGGCEGCPTYDLPQVTVTSQAPDHLWRINGKFMTERQVFMLGVQNDFLGHRLLREEFGTSTAIKFMQYDVQTAIFNFGMTYVNGVLLNIGPGAGFKLGLAGAKYGGLFVAITGGIKVRKAAWGIKQVGSRNTFLYSAIGFKLGFRHPLGRKFPTLFGPPASHLHTAIGRNAIPIGLGTAGAAYGVEKILEK